MIEIRIRDSETGQRNIIAIQKVMIEDVLLFQAWVDQHLMARIRQVANIKKEM